MIQKLHLTIITLLVSTIGIAQIGIGTTSPDLSSALDITATTKGFLMPRVTTAQRTAIASPATGLQVFDTDTSSFWYYNGAEWTEGNGVGKFVDGANSNIAYYDGNVGIGINNTSHKLHVNSPSDLSSTNTAVRTDAAYTGTGTSTATYGLASYVKNTSTGTITYAIGTQGIIENNGSGVITSAVGSWPQVNNNLGTMDFGGGSFTSVNNYGTMTSGQGMGTYIYNDTGKQIDNATGSYFGIGNEGTISKGYGLYLEYLGSGTITDSYGIYINSNFNKGTGDNFAIYSASDADTYLEGNVGVGTNNPQQKVHISGAMRLEPQATAPAGALGDLYVNTNGNLYFHDGTGWKQVQLN